jgi:titin
LLTFVIGVPDAPDQPIVTEVTKDSALVTWNKPNDGGKPITNYILEKRETMSKRWVRVTKEPIHPYTKFRVPDLLEGCQYEFRVAAENEIGIGDPSPPSKPVFARDPIGIVLNHSFHFLIIKLFFQLHPKSFLFSFFIM